MGIFNIFVLMDTRRDFIKKAALLTGAASLSGILPASVQKAMAINPTPGSTYLDAEHVVILMQENRSFDHMFGTLRGVRGFNDPRAITLPNQNPVWLQSNNKGETYAPFHLDINNTKTTWMSSLPHTWANQVNARNDGKFDQWLESKRSANAEYADMPLTLGYHNRQDIPFYYALADAFTVCDQHFCASLTGTTPNRLFFWTGTIREQQDENSRPLVWNEDADFGNLKWKTYPERLEENGVSWKCYQNEIAVDMGLDDEQDAWLSNFGDNPLEYFEQYNVALYKKHIAYLQKQAADLPVEISGMQQKIATLPAGDIHVKSLQHKLKDTQDNLDDINTQLQKLQSQSLEGLSERERNIHQKAFAVNDNDADYHELTTLTYDDNGTARKVNVPKGDIFHQFREDVNTGKLPTVSWLTAPQNFSDHPSAPWYGAWYVSEVMDILTQNPEVWKKTIFILTYDENDGYFDHVPPFTAPHSHKPGTGKVSGGIDTRVDFVTLDQELERKDFPVKDDTESPIGLGYRVPMVIASPWSRGGWVNSEVFDHTSTLQFLETFLNKKTDKKVTETNISDWRRTVSGNLTSVFRPYCGEKIAEPDFLSRDSFVEGIHKAKFKKLPSDYQLLSAEQIAQIKQDPHASLFMPRQETGIKPSCALLYELYADGKLSADKKSFDVKFTAGNGFFGDAALGSPFNVYAPGRYLQTNGQMGDLRTWAYALKAGDSLSDTWPLSEFEDSHYHLRVYGPNGFMREFAGNANDPEIEITAYYDKAFGGTRPGGNLVIKTSNLDTQQPYTLEIIDNAYKTHGSTRFVPHGPDNIFATDLEKSHNWYDITVKIKGNSHYMRRFAGRVETGKHGHSDPLMGGVIA